MTTPNTLDTAIDTIQAGTVAAAAALEETPLVTTLDDPDPDLVELEEARKALDAETAGQTTQTEVPPSAAPGEGAAGNSDEPPAPAASDGRSTPSIPMPRFKEVLDERDTAKQRIAYLEGQLEALKTVQPAAPAGGAGTGAQPAQPAQPERQYTPQERLAQIDQARINLAEKFDNGDITAKQWEQEKAKLATYERHFTQQAILAAVPQPAAPASGGGDTAYLETMTAELETKYPHINAFTVADNDPPGVRAEKDRRFGFIVDEAKADMEARGIKFDNSEMGRYRFREAVSQQAEKWGPQFFPGFKANTQPASSQQQQLSPAAAARAGKLASAADFPPDITSLPSGGSGAGGGDYSHAQIEAMTDEEIAALPPSVKAKFLGG